MGGDVPASGEADGRRRSAKRRAVVWFVIAGVCFVISPVFGLGVPGGYAFSRVLSMEREAIPLAFDQPVRRARSAWPGSPTVFVSKGALRTVAPSEVRAGISVSTASGDIPLRVNESTSVSGPSGEFGSVASFDLTGVAPDAEVRVDATGLAGVVPPGTVRVSESLDIGTLVVTIFLGVGVGSVMLLVCLGSVIRAFILLRRG